MASGTTLLIFRPQDNEPPSSSYATFDTRNQHPVLDFDDSTSESAVFSGVMPRAYDGGGLTVYLHWAATTATSGGVTWDIAFERIGDNQQDMDSNGFATAQSASDSPSITSGYVVIHSDTFTDGAQMDSIAVGEGFRMKITRNTGDSGDTMTGDAELRFIEIKET